MYVLDPTHRNFIQGEAGELMVPISLDEHYAEFLIFRQDGQGKYTWVIGGEIVEGYDIGERWEIEGPDFDDFETAFCDAIAYLAMTTWSERIAGLVNLDC